MASNLFNSLGGKAVEEAARRQALIQLKKGKTSEQKDCIDFFTTQKKGCNGCLGFGGNHIMSMDEYVQKVQEKCRRLNLRSRAVTHLGIDEEDATALIDPLCLYGYELDLDDDSLLIKLEDNKVVSSKYTISWLFFSETQVYIYSYKFDMTSDDVWEYCREYFYQDITCFETEEDIVEKIDIRIAQGCLGGESVEKNNYTREIVKITVPGSSCKITMRNAGTQMQNIQAVKALLREKKFLK